MTLEVITDLQALHPVFASWWQARGVAVIPAEMLPRLGIMAVEDGSPVAAVWMYMDNSIPLGFLTWFITRPGLPARTAREALEHLLAFMAQEARRLGISSLIASCPAGSSLARLLTRHGYAVAGTGLSHHFSAI